LAYVIAVLSVTATQLLNAGLQGVIENSRYSSGWGLRQLCYYGDYSDEQAYAI
jgi:hypothetical protein